MKTAFITGYSGQDGTLLTDLLLNKGYRVIGLTRRISTEPPRRVRGCFSFCEALADHRLVLEAGDMLSTSSLNRIVGQYQPDEVYNLAWQSHVGFSFKTPEVSLRDYEGYTNLINALESCHKGFWRLYQASTSEMYGNRDDLPILNELTPLRPNSPYAIAKTAAHYYGAMKRGQGMFISNGILFNHESEIRGGDFVTQKIARGVHHWLETKEPIHLGNMDSCRDWGYAGDFVEGMWRMLQHNKPDDFVLATGKTHTIREFATAAFKALDLEIKWSGSGINEVGLVDGKTAVVIDEQFYRPNEVGYLLGDSTKARTVLGWKPKHDFNSLVEVMVEAAK